MDPVDQVKQKIDLVEFISEYLTLKKVGVNYAAICPFHAEKTASFMVSPMRQLWRCFGCDLGGDVFAFLEEKEGLTFSEVLDTLAKRAGVKIDRKAHLKWDQKDRLYEINNLASKFYNFILTEHEIGKRAREYLTKRGVAKDSIKQFEIGYAPDNWELTFKFLGKKGYEIADIATSGLLVGKARGGFYDRFRNRIIFPIRDFSGKVAGFSGRVLDGVEKEIKEAKYINSPETPIFNKGSLFFGLDLAKDYIRSGNCAILVEGEFDVISSFQAGVKNVVATKGTALTPNQVDLLHRFCETVIFAFDADFAGDAAAQRAIETADSKGLNIKVIKISGGKDPDQIVKDKPDLWQKLVKESVGVYDFLIDLALRRYDRTTAEGIKKIGQELLPVLAKISDDLVRAHYIDRLAARIDVESEILWQAMQKKLPKTISSDQAENLPTKANVFSQSRREKLEEFLIALILQKDQELNLFQFDLPEVGDFTNPALKKLYQEYIISASSKDETFDFSLFVEKLDIDVAQIADRLALVNLGKFVADNEAWQDEFEKTAKELKKLILKERLKKLSEQISLAEKSNQVDKLNVLRKKFSELSTSLTKY